MYLLISPGSFLMKVFCKLFNRLLLDMKFVGRSCFFFNFLRNTLRPLFHYPLRNCHEFDLMRVKHMVTEARISAHAH